MTGRIASAPNRNSAWTAALFEEWERAGLAHVCISPGSRSAPLAIAAAASSIPRSTHLDERSAAFFALGLAKATRQPVALVCTSGTAAANYAPAVVEAHYARVPLLVLTADRPPELREWGAGQTIDQHGLYGSHVRWFAEAPLPEATPDGLRHARSLAVRALDVARGAPPGPVHLNLPFRDPLDPRPVASDVPSDLERRDPLAAAGRAHVPYARVRRGATAPSPDDVASLAERMRASERGVVLCGPQDHTPDDVAAIADLARRLGWPLLAEATSQLRAGPHTDDAIVVTTAHALSADADFAASHRPDFVLRFGAAPTTKTVAQWLAADPPDELVVVDPGALWHDADHLVSEWHDAATAAFCAALVRRLGSDASPTPWLAAFARAERTARAAIDARLGDDEALLEPHVVRELAAGLSPESTLYVSSSMPIRDLDAFWPAASVGPRVLCNRGANGIDGMVSSALGAATAGPTVLFTGDVALLHDVSGLLAVKRSGAPLVIVVLDNDGGGIFSMLPVAVFGESAAFTEHFTTPHGHDLNALCSGIGLANTRVGSWPHFRAALKDATARCVPHVLVIPTDAEASISLRREITAAVGAALAEDAR